MLIFFLVSRQNQDLELADEVQSVNKKLNYLDFDEVCENLRSDILTYHFKMHTFLLYLNHLEIIFNTSDMLAKLKILYYF